MIFGCCKSDFEPLFILVTDPCLFDYDFGFRFVLFAMVILSYVILNVILFCISFHFVLV